MPDIVVLLTDGANTRGITPLDAVPYAVERRVRVYTIGFGTTQPDGARRARRSSSAATPQRFGGGGFGGGGFGGGGGSPLRADNDTLRQVAEQTGGTAYSAEDAAQLRKVFADLPKDVTVQKQPQRGQRRLRRPRRPARRRRHRRLDPLERLPLDLRRRGPSLLGRTLRGGETSTWPSMTTGRHS